MTRFEDPDLQETYAAADTLKVTVLRDLDSLLSPGSRVWTSQYVDELHTRFVSAPDPSADSFQNKLRRQLEGADPKSIQLMAELLYLHLLMARDIKGDTKRRNISTVLARMPAPPSIPATLDAALDGGFASAGMGFRSRRPTQITYLIEFARKWVDLNQASRQDILDDPWTFKQFVYSVESPGTPESQRNALLYLVHPGTFEDIVSQYHKRDIVDEFGELAPGEEDVDRALLAIRSRIEAETGEVARFYREPLVSQWQKAQEASAEAADDERESIHGWLVRAGRSSNSHVADWLTDGYCAIGWRDAGPIEPGLTRKEIVARLEEAHPDESKGWVRSSAGNIHRFVNKFAAGDIVVTPNGQDVYVGIVTSAAYEDDGAVQPRRRSVDWVNPADPIPRSSLSDSAYTKLRTLVTVSDISEDVAEFAKLVDVDVTGEGPTDAGQGSIMLKRVDTTMAEDLHLPSDWINEILELLEEKKQVIFYGPPGTGKTYLAQQLADYLTESEATVLVQFHPSYAYEDFFEGFRPQESGSESGVTFELVPGPLRRLADVAREDRSRPYVLVIDEINRANLAKVFGELYFLLEYRDRTIALQYGGETEFSLPKNLFIIGTMNTADRSIAFVDAAMRRRFYFVPFFPGAHPIDGILPSWLRVQEMDGRPAELLAELNHRIDDEDFSIGPSYLMTETAATSKGLQRIWKHAILPLLEEHYSGAGRDVAGEFGLEAIAKAIEQGLDSDAENEADPGELDE